MSLQINEACPAFDLPGTDDKTHSLDSFKDADLLVVVVSCNHCPYVIAYEERMVALAREVAPKKVASKKTAPKKAKKK